MPNHQFHNVNCICSWQFDIQRIKFVSKKVQVEVDVVSNQGAAADEFQYSLRNFREGRGRHHVSISDAVDIAGFNWNCSAGIDPLCERCSNLTAVKNLNEGYRNDSVAIPWRESGCFNI